MVTLIMYVIRNGKRVELANVNDVVNGDNVALEGEDIMKVKFVREIQVKQPRNARYNTAEEGEAVPEVAQFQFSVQGRVLTITGEGNVSMAELLLATVKKTAKKGDRVKKLFIIANDFHPTLKDGEGNPLFEDEAETIPALNRDITNHSWVFDGLVTANEIEADQDDEIAFSAKRRKAGLLNVNPDTLNAEAIAKLESLLAEREAA